MSPGPAVTRLFDTFVVRAGADVRKGLAAGPDADVLVGHGARVRGPIRARSVYLAKGAIVQGPIQASLDLVLGALALVAAPVTCAGNLLLLEGARVLGDCSCAGSAKVVGATITGVLRAGGDVEVRGDANLLRIESQGRVRSLPVPEVEA